MNRSIRRIPGILTLVLSVGGFAQNLQRELPLPDIVKKGIPVFPENPVLTLKPSGEEAALLAVAVHAVKEGKEGKEAKENKEGKGRSFLRVSLAQAPKKAGAAVLAQVAPGPLALGEKILVMVVARNGGTATETGEVDLDLQVLATAPKALSLSRSTITAGRAWKRFFFFFEAPLAVREGALQLRFIPGGRAMAVDLYELQVYRFPPETQVDSLPVTRLTWAGRDENATWRKEALARIEGLRRGALEVQVVNARGKALSGVPVKLEMKRHGFPFGTAVDGEWTVGAKASDPLAEKHEEVLTTWFRRGVECGLTGRSYRQADAVTQAKRAADWIQRKGLSNAGGLVYTAGRWDGLEPSAETRYREVARTNRAKAMEVLKKNIRESMKDGLGRLKDSLGEWHLVSDPNSDLVYTDLFPPEEICDWFKLVQTAAPRATRVLSAAGMFTGGGLATNRLEPWLRMAMVLNGLDAPVDAIALPARFGSALPPPEKLYDLLGRFAALGKPLELIDLAVEAKDEVVQAEYLKEILIVGFSHASVRSIDLAGFWEGSLWKAGAPRQAGNAYTQLLGHDFWTTAEGLTDEQGFFRVRGYVGDYTLAMKRGDLTETMKIAIIPGSTSFTETVR
ncbi:MAG: hypothetical protein J0L75_17355 [Spirochaetes bacterium]|nr:hypothetical protein [Spirochaetota bacterium]